jgi:hypothetical protein
MTEKRLVGRTSPRDPVGSVARLSARRSGLGRSRPTTIRSLEEFERMFFPRPDPARPFGGLDPEVAGAKLAREALAGAIAALGSTGVQRG